jgi:hypothetical protein
MYQRYDKKMRPIHLIGTRGVLAACGVGLIGAGPCNTAHDPRDVTCGRCKKTRRYKSRMWGADKSELLQKT